MERGPPNMTVTPPEHRINDSHNSTDYNENEDPLIRLNFYDWRNLLSLFIALLGLIGNGAVLWLLGFRIRRNPFSIYILNLAVADAIFLCFSFLITIDTLFRSIFEYLTGIMLLFLRFIFYTAGLSLLAAISTERCLSVLFPIWYRCRRPKHTSAAVCAGLWALAGVFGLLSLVFGDCFYLNLFTFITIQGSWFLLVTFVMGVSSLTLLLRVQCGSQRRRLPRFYLLILLTVLVFLFCGLPWGIWAVLYFWFNIFLIPYWLCDLLACVNSSVNPLIYFFIGRLGNRKREPLRVVLQRAFGDEQELGSGTTNIPHASSPETTLGA
ncbi:mas-related G-protein coupled receptor member X4-like [Antechinus flavipes]|uniref:mas-related G-protein coupled receptor member X4-like n=1 Tax=Antechinus flavipes TaxID=38775 RepID=UPI0022363348|nr:mas-related G-protein coupled receptor member X4-like [Antechinus flavipes]